MGAPLDVVVVGAGQAGLAVSHELTRAGVDHVVLERGRAAQRWRGRWDSFCLVTPNWTVRLPGGEYDGDDPDGFMVRDQVVAHLQRYGRAFAAPLREGVEVTSLERYPGGGFRLTTGAGDVLTRQAVLCTGAYQQPHRPREAAALPADVLQLDVDDYRNPDALPSGPVLVIGSGQSGCQIAEELHQADRNVFLACGRAGWTPRRIAGRDAIWWLMETGDLDDELSSLPDPRARLIGNMQASGRDGGHDLHFRTLRRMGVTLLGHLAGCEGRHARFAPDLAATLTWADERYARFMDRIRGVCARQGLPPPQIPEPEPLAAQALEDIDLTGFGAVLFASGYRPEYRRWVHIDGAFDELGFPVHRAGQSTVAPGLHFVGVHFLRRRKSSLLAGVGEDAALVADNVRGALLASGA